MTDRDHIDAGVSPAFPIPIKLPPLVVACAALALSGLLTPVEADDSLWRLCPALEISPPANTGLDEPPRLSADRVFSADGQRTVVTGNAELYYLGSRVNADRIEIDTESDTGSARGNIIFRTPDSELRGESADFSLSGDYMRFRGATYLDPEAHLRGRAEQVERFGDSTTVLEDAYVTSCPPQAEDWRLASSHVKLDHEKQQGTAKHARLYFKNVPILYSPWFRFPIGEDRQTGLLAPSLGFSSSRGTEILVPWYWNIHPQADATFTPRYMSERGTQLIGEFRGLTRQGDWQFNGAYLDDREFGDVRTLGRVVHDGNLGSNWATSILATKVSDDQYFNDLGNSLSIASLNALEQRADITYYGSLASARARVQSYQAIDDDPYRRLPQITWRTTRPVSGDFDYSFDGEWVQFGHTDLLEGRRFDFRPTGDYRFGGPAWFVTPRATAWHTQYKLDDDNGAVADDEPTRTLPVLSLDTGLFFERNTDSLLQTLEPRLFYLYVPYEDQDDIPVFDTTRYTFSFEQMFRNNRFTGPDRVGDANQLTAAVTSRFIDPDSGVESASLDIGQIYYFADRRVTLPGAPIETRPSSDVFAQAEWLINDPWSTSGWLQYNPDANTNDRAAFQLHYRNGSRNIANLGYRYTRDELEQVDTSVRWQLSTRWGAVGRWTHSLLGDRNLELLAGFEYESCCWLFRGVAREYIVDDGDGDDRSVYVQLVLKGLAVVGNSAASVLESGILGYRDPGYR